MMHCDIEKAGREIRKADILVLSGFSGSGKGDVCRLLVQKKVNGRGIALIRSVTNRKPRFEGENYTFVSRETFEALAESGRLLEFNGNYASHGYGTPLWAVHDAVCAGQTPLLEIDVSGLIRLRTEGRADPARIHSVFLVPPSAAELVRRLRYRGTETDAEIRSRLQRALTEAKNLRAYDAVIVNDITGAAAERVTAAFEGRIGSDAFDADAFCRELESILSAWTDG